MEENPEESLKNIEKEDNMRESRSNLSKIVFSENSNEE